MLARRNVLEKGNTNPPRWIRVHKKVKGRLITLEGTEGSGKSLQAKLLCRYLKRLGHKVIHTTEPGSTNIGKVIRKVLLDPSNKSLMDVTELFLYLADRSQHVEEIIQPNLKKGYIVVCDRFIDATAAYQGYGRKLPLTLIHRLNILATKGIKPDLTIVLDVPLEIGLRRAIKVGPYTGDRIEREAIAFHRRVRRGYLELARKEPKRIRVVKVRRSINEIQDRIRELVDKIVKKH